MRLPILCIKKPGLFSPGFFILSKKYFKQARVFPLHFSQNVQVKFQWRLCFSLRKFAGAKLAISPKK